jgi:predicted tellurium resistance membrane protein TerC
LTAMLDETYQRADARYTNSIRLLAMVFALGLALAGSWILNQTNFQANLAAALIVGILATPLAPITKDLSTALATAVNAMQAVRK